MKALFILGFSLSHLVAMSQVDHTLWTRILKSNINAEGLVNYKNLHEKPEQLDKYLNLLSQNPPTQNWTSDEQKAFWINAYNAFTVKLIIDNYPTKSIKDIAGKIYKINTPWDIKFIKIGLKTYDLNNIEHNILRKEFEDPRIHFAINCASISCPNLRNEAYEATRIEAQLNEQAKIFINDNSKNIIENDKVLLSRIFSWFKGDFTKTSNLQDFINKYADFKISDDSKLNYMKYNWELNEQ